jgi:autotransporter-associated beta strand protein
VKANVIFWDGGGATGSWSLIGNWGTSGANTGTDPLAIPGSGDDVVFSSAGATRITSDTVDQNFTLQSLTFGNRQSSAVTIVGTSTLTLTGNANYDPSVVSSGSSVNLGMVGIYLQSGSGAVTISAPITLGSDQQWINNSGNTLTVGSVTNGNNTLTLGGTGNTIISGALGNGAGGLTLNGTGTLTLSALNTYTGDTTINAGTLSLSSIPAAGRISSNSRLVLAGGALNLTFASGGVQAVKGVLINAGSSTVTTNAIAYTLTLHALTRSAGGAVDFTLGSPGTATTTTSNGQTTILGGWATAGGSTWAVSASTGGSAGAISGLPLASYGNSYTSATSSTNFDATTTSAFTNTAVNSLRFNTGVAGIATLNGAFSIGSGGILVTSATSSHLSTITGGTSLTSGNGVDLIIIENNTNVAGGLTIASNITGAISLTTSGPGLVTLSGAASDFSGGSIFMDAGTLSISNNANLGAAGNNIRMDGSTLQATSSFTLDDGLGTVRAIAVTLNGGTIDVTGSNKFTVDGVISGVGSLTKTSAGTLILSGLNTYTGGTKINGGELSLGVVQGATSGPLGGGTASLPAGIISFGGGTLQFSGINTTDYSSQFSTAASQAYSLDTNNQTVTLASPLTSSSGTLNKIGPGTLVLIAQSTYSGATTTIQNGTLRIGIVNALPPGTSVTLGSIGNSAALDLGSGTGSFNQTIAGLTTAGTTASQIITNNDSTGATHTATLTVNNDAATSNANFNFGGVIQDGASGSRIALTKTGSKILTLSGSNTYTGGTNISGGELNLGVVQAATSGPLGGGTGSLPAGIISFGGGTLQFSNVNTTDYSSQFSTAANQAYSLDTNSQTVTLASALSSTGGTLTKSGAGTLILSGLNTYTGSTKINGGVLSLGVAQGTTSGPLGGGTASLPAGIISFGGGMLQFSSVNTTDYSGQFSAASSQAYSLDTNNQTVTLGSPLGSSGGTLAKLGGGTLTLSAASNYTGVSTVSGGTLSLSTATGSINASSGVTIGVGATLLLDNTSTANNTNRLKDTGSVIMNGGTVNFSNNGGAANYSETTGPLTVSSGASTLIASQAASSQTSILTFSSLVRSAAATVNFTGTGLGVDTRNEIKFTSAPTLASWATYNGTDWASYDSTLGVVALPAASYSNINALGSTINSSATANERINAAGTGGNIALSTTPASLNTLLQSSSTAATVDTNGKTFKVSGVMIGSGQQSLTIGIPATVGFLEALLSNGELVLANYSGNLLTINSIVANNTGASSLTVSGTGITKLTGANSFTGNVQLDSGTLNLGAAQTVTTGPLGGGTGSLPAGTIFFNGGTLQHSVSNSADYSSKFSATANQFYSVDTNGSSVTWATPLSSIGGSLIKSGGGTLILSQSGGNSYTSGTAVSGGTLLANNATGSATGGGAVGVASGATLAGTGTISGLVTVAGGPLSSTTASGGIIGAGDAGVSKTGILTLGGGLSLAPTAGSTSTYTWGFTSPAAYDMLTVNTLSIGIGSAVDVLPVLVGTALGFTGQGQFEIIHGSGAQDTTTLATQFYLDSSAAPGFMSAIGATGNTFTFSGDATGDIFMNYSTAPEPTSMTLFGLGAGSLILRRRKRQNGKWLRYHG